MALEPGTDMGRLAQLLADYRIGYRLADAAWLRRHEDSVDDDDQAIVAGETPSPDRDAWDCGMLAVFRFDAAGQYQDYFLIESCGGWKD